MLKVKRLQIVDANFGIAAVIAIYKILLPVLNSESY